MIPLQRKLRQTIIALGACFAVVVAVVAVTTHRLAGNLSELLRAAAVQSDLRSLDDALDHARADVDAYLLSGDRALLRHSAQHIALAESTFARLVTPAEVQRSQVQALTQLRTEMSLLERALDSRQAAKPAARARALALTQDDPQQRAAIGNLTIDVIGRLERAADARVLATADGFRAIDTALWLAVLALAAIGGAIALVSYRSMRVDLARRARAEEAIRESEAKFAGILAIAADAIVTAEEHGRIVDFNQSAEAMFGYRAADIVGQPLHLLLPNRLRDVRAPATAAEPDDAASGELGAQRLQLVARRFSGDVFSVEAAASRLPTRNGCLLTIVLRDVTADRRLERRDHLLAEAATLLSPRLSYDEQLSVITQLGVPSIGDWCALDVVEEVEDGRTRLHRITSTPRDRRLEGALWEMEAHAPHWAAGDPVTDVIRTGVPLFVPQIGEGWLTEHYADETTRDIMRQLDPESLIMMPLRSDERVIGVMTIGTSSPRRAATDEFELARLLADRAAPAIEAARLYRKSQRSTAARDAFLGIVSHDLSGALATIAMLTKALSDARGDEDRHDKLCANILEASAVMRRLMLDLVDISAIEAHRLSVSPETASLAPILESLRSMYAGRAEARGVELEVALGSDLPLVRADGTRILQVLGNLVDNAIKFTPAGGSVAVETVADGREVLVAVRDTGAGVSPDELPHIFERFWRAKSSRGTRGFGLGLAIVHGIVTAHGGRAWMDSTLGRGSTVYFTLPRAGSASPLTSATGQPRRELSLVEPSVRAS